MTPTVLLYDRPRTGLEGKFSLHYCAAAAVLDDRIGPDTFEDERVTAEDVQALLPRVTMRVDATLDPSAPPLTQAALTVRLRDGRELGAMVRGARGYPEQPASLSELESKFRGCAERVLPAPAVDRALECLRHLEQLPDASTLADALVPPPA
jgi:2-methylcitrate dehydratase PrpD